MTDLAELYARDPLQYTKADITEIVTSLRAQRAQYTLGNMKAGSAKPKTEKQKKMSALAGKLGELKL